MLDGTYNPGEINEDNNDVMSHIIAKMNESTTVLPGEGEEPAGTDIADPSLIVNEALDGNYHCNVCGADFEIVESTEDDTVICPACQSTNVEFVSGLNENDGDPYDETAKSEDATAPGTIDVDNIILDEAAEDGGEQDPDDVTTHKNTNGASGTALLRQNEDALDQATIEDLTDPEVLQIAADKMEEKAGRYLSLMTAGKIDEAIKLTEGCRITMSSDNFGTYVIAESTLQGKYKGKKAHRNIRSSKVRSFNESRGRKLTGTRLAEAHRLRRSLANTYLKEGLTPLQAQQKANRNVSLYESVNESAATDVTGTIVSTMKTVFNTKGFNVDSAEVVDSANGLYQVDIIVVDNDTTVYLDEISDELSGILSADVSATEPREIDQTGRYLVSFFVDYTMTESATEEGGVVREEDKRPPLTESMRIIGQKRPGRMNEAAVIEPEPEGTYVLTSDKGYLSEESTADDVIFTSSPDEAMVFLDESDASDYMKTYDMNEEDWQAKPIQECSAPDLVVKENQGDVIPPELQENVTPNPDVEMRDPLEECDDGRPMVYDVGEQREDRLDVEQSMQESRFLTQINKSYKARAQVSPKHIKEGATILDRDSCTLFKVLESKGGRLTIDVLASNSSKYRGLKGAIVGLTESGKYYQMDSKKSK